MLKVHWVNSPSDNPLGNHVGYSKANARLMRALGKVCEITDSADIAVHFLAPLWFSPIKGKTNVLFTMFESDDQDYYLNLPEGCDLIVTPSRFCKKIFERATNIPVVVCNLGVDPQIFTYKARQAPGEGERFRWLFLGAPNPRKYSIMEEIYKALLSKLDNVELYIKTTGADIESGLREIGEDRVNVSHDGAVIRHQNWTVDNRFLPTSSIVDLMHSSHAFLALHMGEGWGQNLLEAMCTGLPCVVSDYSATREFADIRNSFPVPVSIEKTEVGIGKDSIDQLIKIDAAVPDPFRAMDQIMNVMQSYKSAVKVGKKAHKSASSITWGRAAAKLRSILERVDSPR